MVFRACLPRRGRKAEDDRRFLEALHFFTVENVRWRALPERFGPWNSVWKRFDRLSYLEVLSRDLQVMDASAISLARENRIPILVFSIHNRGGFADVVSGKGLFTIITEES